ncbi:MAG: TRAP transporter substrate-binding protein DctP [Gammaproteobacteria bacterium]|nr:TRAP transporter substrate-binding protein DctP [Gammaproteobacteria bacterium]MDH5777398.1 TRAP transporter substrate-binding protein DctP [Gammaproteobacteria bacterium]
MRLKSALFIFLAIIVPVSQAGATVLKIATLAPDGTSWMNEMRAAGKAIAKRTNNRVELKFYPGGIMGNEKSVMRKIRIGQLHGSALTNAALSKIAQNNQIYSLPMRFKSYEEMNYVRSKLDKVLLDGLKQKGYTAYRIAGDGFSYLLSREPVKNIEDLARQKVWVPKGDVVARAVLEEINVSPVSLPLTDVLTGLQTGLFSTIGSPPVFAIALQWHTKVSYLLDVPLFFTYGALTFSNKSLKKISKADQQVMQEEINNTFKKLNKQNWDNNIKAKQALASQGIKFLQPSKQELAAMQELADKTTNKLIKQGVFSAELVNKVDQLLAEFRKKK